MLQTTLEVLHALYHRVNYSREEVEKLVCPLLSPEALDLFRRMYERLAVDIDNVNEARYIALKRLSEVCVDRSVRVPVTNYKGHLLHWYVL